MLLPYPRRRKSESLGVELEYCGFKSPPHDSPEHPGENPDSVLPEFNHAFCLISVSAVTSLSIKMGLPGSPLSQ